MRLDLCLSSLERSFKTSDLFSFPSSCVRADILQVIHFEELAHAIQRFASGAACARLATGRR